MKKILFYFLALITLFFLIRCDNEPKPEVFGWYVVLNNKELIKLQQQQDVKNIRATGGDYVGFSTLSKIIVPDTTIHFIIFDNGLSSLTQNLKLCSIKFVDGGIRNNYWVDVKLFTVGQNIPIEITPINDESQMYKIVPKLKLINGNYALYLSDAKKFNKNSMIFDFKISVGEEEIKMPSKEWLSADISIHYSAYGDSVESVAIINITDYEKRFDLIVDITFNYMGKKLVRQHKLGYAYDKDKKKWKNQSYSMPPLMNDYTSPFRSLN
ncbi:MAG: hypothetical protein DAHOPDDO_02906 [Ignavibacteriaceae bacterium]|nr:hypothetical protein [Ignavibacteriaceae bacterium]